MRFVLLSILLFANHNLFSDSFYFNTTNNHGNLGVINIPSARFYSDPSISLGFYRGDPDRKINLTFYPYPWFEAGIFYASFKGLPYSSDKIFTQDRKDKGFNFKIRIKEEDNLPAIAIGANDIGGTGYYSSEYIVSSYNYGNFDFHLGIGWGALNHGKIKFQNPFISISDKFKLRDSQLEQGGKLNFNNYFSGEKAALFGGFNYAFGNNLVFKLEVDPTNTNLGIPFPSPKSDFSFGIDYLMGTNHVIGASFERGSHFSIRYVLRDIFSQSEKKEYKSMKKLSGNELMDLRKILAKNSIGVTKIEKSKDKTRVHISQYLYNSFDQVNYVTEKAIKDAGLQEEIVKVYKIAGLEIYNEDHTFHPTEIIYEEKFSRINQGFSLNLRPFIAGREDFLKAGLFLEHDMEIIFSENFFLSSNLKLSIIDNFDDLIFPPVDTYPAQVRSDVKKYLNNIGDRPSIGRLQLEYFNTFAKNNHLLLSAGIYEEMFSGYGFEYLKKNINKKLSWGIEAHKVYKRDYDLGFNLLDYKNLTYHLNLYYENKEIIPFDLKISYGEYLAGDKGYTFELSRRFNSGVEFGVFASITDVSFDDYGEGSFDKGIFFKIPIGEQKIFRNFVWRPLTKDPASKLIRKNDLFSLTRKYSKDF